MTEIEHDVQRLTHTSRYLKRELDEAKRSMAFVVELIRRVEVVDLTHSEKRGVLKIAEHILRYGLPRQQSPDDEIPF